MRYKASICAIVKDEGRYIREWLSYHSAIGFEHFFIFDNESTDDTSDALRLAQNKGICSYQPWPSTRGPRPQLSAYKTGLQLARQETEWLAFIDADEFINLKKHRSIGDFLTSYSDADAIGINWRIFGSSSEIGYRPKLVMERFRYASPVLFGANHHIKTIAKTSALVKPFIHTHNLVDGSVFLNADRTLLKGFPAARQDAVSHDIIQINHYFTKSYEEWCAKKARGKADFSPESPDRLRSDSEFTIYDRNDEKDETILFWRDETIRKMMNIFLHI